MTAEDRVKLATERKLVFANLANGVPVARVMAAFHLSEKDVMERFAFVWRKIKSYRFERGMPFASGETIRDAEKNAPLLLHTLERVDLSEAPRFSRIETLPIDPQPGRPSDAERKIQEMAMKTGQAQA